MSKKGEREGRRDFQMFVFFEIVEFTNFSPKQYTVPRCDDFLGLVSSK